MMTPEDKEKLQALLGPTLEKMAKHHRELGRVEVLATLMEYIQTGKTPVQVVHYIRMMWAATVKP